MDTDSEKMRVCQNCKRPFTIEAEDFAFYKKIKVPPPTWCPECRLIRRFMFRNDRTLYKRPCNKCKKDIISIYHKDKPYTVYCQQCWWADDWDSLSYGLRYNPSRSFFEQFDTLLRRVPLMANFVVNEKTMVNSPYNNMVSYLKNCYLLTNADYNENCAYGCEVQNSKECFDMNLADHCELSYECVNCQNCYRTFFSSDCQTCNSVWYSHNLISCNDCVGCVNLRGKQYHIFNQPYTKEEYQQKVKTLGLGSYHASLAIRERAKKLALGFPNKYVHGFQNTASSGEYIYQSKNTRDSWLVTGCEDVRYSQYLVAKSIKDSYDYTQYGDGAELMYEALQSGNNCQRVRFSWFAVVSSYNITYGVQNFSCEDVFGCVAVRKKRYCILNVQYTEGEYRELMNQIIEDMRRRGEWGEFFSPSISPFGYNETTAQQYFPLLKAAAQSKGYKWQDSDPRQYQPTIAAEDLPEFVADVADAILNDIIQCAHKGECAEQCATAFRFISSELQFYKQMGLPLPRLCPNCRHYARLAQRNPPKLWRRACQCTGQASENEVYKNVAVHSHAQDHCSWEFESAYSPERKEIVYCEQCYQSEVA